MIYCLKMTNGFACNTIAIHNKWNSQPSFHIVISFFFSFVVLAFIIVHIWVKQITGTSTIGLYYVSFTANLDKSRCQFSFLAHLA